MMEVKSMRDMMSNVNSDINKPYAAFGVKDNERCRICGGTKRFVDDRAIGDRGWFCVNEFCVKSLGCRT